MNKNDIKKIHSGIKWIRTASRGRLHAILYLENVGLATINHLEKDEYNADCPGYYYRQFDGSRWIALSDYGRIKNFYDKKIKTDSCFFIKIAENRIKINKRLLKLVLKYKNTQWETMNNNKLMKILDEWQYLEGAHWGGIWFYGYYFYVNDIYLEKYKKYLQKKYQTFFNELWDYVLIPEKISEIGQEKIDLLKLARKNILGKLNNSDIKNHVNRYNFVTKYYFWGKELDKKLVKKNLDEYKRKGMKFISEELKKISSEKVNPEKFKLSVKDKKIIEGVKKLSFSLNQNDDTSNYVICQLRGYFAELAKRLGVGYNELISMRGKEIKTSLLRNKLLVSKQELRERLEDHALIFAKKKIYTLSGEDLLIYKKQELKKQKINNKIKEVKGVVASPGGLIAGKVVVIDNDEKINKFKKGNILVTQMTNPAFVPAMKKAGAIITDEGGLLCHAAIISRELKKPCIIGTKIATQVLHDGGMVEVDADRGIVKIIKSNK